MQNRPVGIFGAGGEIGRNILRVNTERQKNGKGVLPITHLVEGFHSRDDIVALLNEDKVRGPLPIPAEKEGDHGIRIGDNVMHVHKCNSENTICWKDLGVWGVIEASGARVETPLAQEHIDIGGADKVLVTAPTKGDSPKAKTLIMGYNEAQYTPKNDHLLTNESCTTKSALHLAESLEQDLYIDGITLTTVHAETGQPKRALLESEGKVDELSTLGFVPQETGSQGALSKLYPDAKVSAVAYRVPVTDGSISDIVFTLSDDIAESEVRSVLEAAARENILQIVNTIRSSADLIGNPHDAVLARDSITMVTDNQVRMRAGYDNAFAPARAALDAMAFMRRQR